MPFLEERGLNYKVYRNYEFNIGHVKFEVLLRLQREDVKLVDSYRSIVQRSLASDMRHQDDKDQVFCEGVFLGPIPSRLLFCQE